MAKEKETKVTDPELSPIQSAFTPGMKVEVSFPNASPPAVGIKQDKDIGLIAVVQFHAPIRKPLEIARLVNLLKQSHGPLTVTISSDQAVFDLFMKDESMGEVAILEAPKVIESICESCFFGPHNNGRKECNDAFERGTLIINNEFAPGVVTGCGNYLPKSDDHIDKESLFEPEPKEKKRRGKAAVSANNE